MQAPPGKPRTVPWVKVQAHAALGADRDDIVTALNIEELLKDPAVSERFVRELRIGAARYRLDTRRALARLRRRSAHTAIATARNTLGWDGDPLKDRDRQIPDQASAVAEIERALGKLRRPKGGEE